MRLRKKHLWMLFLFSACFLWGGGQAVDDTKYPWIGFWGAMGITLAATGTRRLDEVQAWMRERISLLSQIEGKALFWVSDTGHLLWMNGLAESFLGKVFKDHQGVSLWDVLTGVEYVKEKQGQDFLSHEEKEAFKETIHIQATKLLMEKEGTRLPLPVPLFLRCGAALMVWEEGTCLKGKGRGEHGILWSMREVTYDSICEQQALEARAMLGSRFVLGSLLHELNNDLNCIFGAMDLVQEMEVESSLLETSRQLTQNAVFSALQNSSAIASLIRKPTGSFAVVSLRQLSLDWMAYLRFRGRERYRIETSLFEEDPHIFGSLGLLQDMFLMLGEALLVIADVQAPLLLSVSHRDVEEIEHQEGGFLLMPGEHVELEIEFRLHHPISCPWEKYFSLSLDGETSSLRLLLMAIAIVLRKHQGAFLIEQGAQERICWRLSFPKRV